MLKKFLKPKIFILFFILAIGAFLRFWGIYHGSFAFTFDVGRDLLSVTEIVKGKLTLLGPTTGIPGVFYGPWWYYLLVLPFFIFSGNPALIVSTIAFLGLINIFLAYLLGGLVLASAVAFSPHFIGTSVQIWNPNLTPFFLLSSFLVFKKILKKTDPFLFFVFGLLTMLTFEMQSAFGIFYLLGILVSLFLFLRKKEVIFFFMGLVLIELPRFLFELRHDFLQTKALASFFSKTGGASFNLGERVFNRLNLFLGEWKFNLGARNDLLAFLILLFSIYFLIKNWRKFSNQEQICLKTLGLTIVTLFLGFLFYSQTVWSYYLIGLPTLYFLVFATVFNKILKESKQKRLFIGGFVFLVLLNLNLPSLWAELKDPKFAGNAAVYRNQIAVIDYIYEDAKGEKFNVIAYTPPLIDYTWRYHFIWYGQKKYGYQPSIEKARLFYLIEEPDFENPERLNLWLEERENDGKMIEKHEVAGGIVVEKRLR